MGKSKIEWTDATWNPVVGCTKVSEGCKFCYASRFAHRLNNMSPHKNPEYIGVADKNGWTGKIELCAHRLDQPLRWRKSRRIFVCSMGDLFHPQVPYDFIDKIFAVMALCPQHQFMVLTKRPKRMMEYCIDNAKTVRALKVIKVARELAKGKGAKLMNDAAVVCWSLPNLCLGVTCENQRTADERIPILLQIPCTKRFLSLEPLLEGIDLENVTMTLGECSFVRGTVLGSDGTRFSPGGAKGIGVDQVIIGCENINGKAGRFDDMMLDTPENEAYFYAAVENVIEQCDNAGVKVFVKQIPINGRVSHEPSEWPEKFRRRDTI